jgi:methyl-accepting chemotaxis protein
MIGAALDEGSGAITRLDGHVTAVGQQATKALLLPKRKAS